MIPPQEHEDSIQPQPKVNNTRLSEVRILLEPLLDVGISGAL